VNAAQEARRMHDRDAEQDCDPAAGATRKCRAQFLLEILRQKQKGKRPPCCSASQPCAACQRQAHDEVPLLRSHPALESIGSLFFPGLVHERRWQRREPPAKPEKAESFPMLRAPPASRDKSLVAPGKCRHDATGPAIYWSIIYCGEMFMREIQWALRHSNRTKPIFLWYNRPLAGQRHCLERRLSFRGRAR